MSLSPTVASRPSHLLHRSRLVPSATCYARVLDTGVSIRYQGVDCPGEQTYSSPDRTPIMEFDLPRTAAVFVLLIVIGVGGLAGSDVMQTSTVLMMVAPSMIAFGLICLGLGVKHGEYRVQST